MFRNVYSLIAVLAALALVQSTASAAELVTFTADATGSKANGFVSVESPYISFSDAVGAGLDVNDFDVQSIGNGLAVFDDDDGSELEMLFSIPVVDLSLDFGNDDPAYTNVGDLAVLKLFSGMTELASVIVVLNRDDVMNQTISYAGGPFDRATFAYTDPMGSPFTGGDWSLALGRTAFGTSAPPR